MPKGKITLFTFYPVLYGHYHISAHIENVTGINVHEHIATVKSKFWAREIAEHLAHVYDVEFKETT